MCEICNDFACQDSARHQTGALQSEQPNGPGLAGLPMMFDWGVAEPATAMLLSKCLQELTKEGWEIVTVYGGTKESQVSVVPTFCHVVVVRRPQFMREQEAPKVTL